MRRDVDVIADFPGEASRTAADFAEATCSAQGMMPDAHPGAHLSPAFRAEPHAMRSSHTSRRQC